MPSLTGVSRTRPQGRSVLVGVIGLGLIIGLSDLLPRAEDVEARLRQFASLDTTSLTMFNHAITQLQQGKASEVEMIRLLEQEVLPPWRAQRQALDQLTTLSRLPVRQKRLVTTLVEYMTARQEGWELLREGLRQHDPRALKLANEKQRQADDIIGHRGAAGKRRGT
jgi:hypothetical protein